MKKTLKNTLMASLLSFCLLAPNLASAKHIDSLLYQWDELHKNFMTSTERHLYRDITYTNGYTFTDSHVDTTKLTDYLAGYYRLTYTRTYRTY
ncbi:hypothetical protein H9660_13810 [Clostridium sp. Sa3CUN1]|uniref:Uncharacterized protein n=1 Tax=Clostridium gallinarum TaxID=2762246 RepID=A0ABR8Q715_9CLOT|nr:hypothetical protein [Clostridium gallinarum]MBD7916221.1 hypothetical protein [Clostridium gallinarum]